MSKSSSKLFNTDEENKVVDMPAKEEPKKADKKKADDIQDIDLSITEKKKFRINGDNSKILRLNTSDLNIGRRLEEGYNKLNDLMEEIAKNLNKDGDYENIMDTVDKLDSEMRVQIDYIFDSNVSEICASEGSMWDPIEGSFRYEHIINVLVDLYENNLNKEFAAMKARVSKHTAKYKQAIGQSKYHK